LPPHWMLAIRIGWSRPPLSRLDGSKKGVVELNGIEPMTS
jgi:hypothetical protein